MLHYSRSWFAAWVESAYGRGGFWPNNRPEQHFRTAAGAPGAFVDVITALLDQRPHIAGVVDVGAGAGALLTALAERRPGLRLVGVDLRARPAELGATIGWVQACWDVVGHRWAGPDPGWAAAIDRPTLLIAHEWLDDLPCPVVRRGPDGWRELMIDPDQVATVGNRLVDEPLAWARRWWPVGDRAEIGLTRDRAWAGLIDAVTPYGGAALMIDYGHLVNHRPERGTLAAYRDGRAVEPQPHPDRNLTAHVAVDAVEAAGVARGAETVLFERQAEVVARLRPDRSGPVGLRDPVGDLVDRSQWAALQSRSVWGSFWWLLQETGSPPS